MAHSLRLQQIGDRKSDMRPVEHQREAAAARRIDADEALHPTRQTHRDCDRVAQVGSR